MLLPKSRNLPKVCKIKLLLLGPSLHRNVMQERIDFLFGRAQLWSFSSVLAAVYLENNVLVEIAWFIIFEYKWLRIVSERAEDVSVFPDSIVRFCLLIVPKVIYVTLTRSKNLLVPGLLLKIMPVLRHLDKGYLKVLRELLQGYLLIDRLLFDRIHHHQVRLIVKQGRLIR